MIFPSHRPRTFDDSGAPPFVPLEDGEGEEAGGRVEADYEVPALHWTAIPPEPGEDALLPVRFIDGSIVTRTVASLSVGQRLRPVLVASIAAADLLLEGRSLTRHCRPVTCRLVCLYADGIDAGELQVAMQELERRGIGLHTAREERLAHDFDTLRLKTHAIAMEALESAERRVLMADASRPTLVDGLLERRLDGAGGQDVPAVGLVKRQIRHPLPAGLHELAYELRPGERTPAFVLSPGKGVELVNIYLRLSAQPDASPSYGIVRVSLTREFLERRRRGEERWRYLSRLAGYLYRLRQRDLGYARAGISIEPIVRVEEHVQALRPPIEPLVAQVHRLLRQEAR